MKSIVGSLVLVLGVAASIAAQEAPPATASTKEHDWLRQFVGEWDTEAEAMMGPGQPPAKCKGTMSSRMLGGLWLITDSQADMLGTKVEALQVLGYDPATKKYIGTWVDNHLGHLWKYQGSVDEKGKTLTLDAEGPDFSTPGKTAQYRDAYEFKSKDHIELTSSMKGPDGNWITFMTAQIRRADRPAAR